MAQRKTKKGSTGQVRKIKEAKRKYYGGVKDKKFKKKFNKINKIRGKLKSLKFSYIGRSNKFKDFEGCYSTT